MEGQETEGDRLSQLLQEMKSMKTQIKNIETSMKVVTDYVELGMRDMQFEIRSDVDDINFRIYEWTADMKADVNAEKAEIVASVEKLRLRIDNNDKVIDEMKLRVTTQKAEVSAELAGDRCQCRKDDFKN